MPDDWNDLEWRPWSEACREAWKAASNEAVGSSEARRLIKAFSSVVAPCFVRSIDALRSVDCGCETFLTSKLSPLSRSLYGVRVRGQTTFEQLEMFMATDLWNREIEKFNIRQPPKGEKDDYDSENSWISDGFPSSSRQRRRGDGR